MCIVIKVLPSRSRLPWSPWWTWSPWWPWSPPCCSCIFSNTHFIMGRTSRVQTISQLFWSRSVTIDCKKLVWYVVWILHQISVLLFLVKKTMNNKTDIWRQIQTILIFYAVIVHQYCYFTLNNIFSFYRDTWKVWKTS